MTNAGKIRGMDDKEKGEFIGQLVAGRCGDCPFGIVTDMCDCEACGTMLERWLGTQVPTDSIVPDGMTYGQVISMMDNESLAGVVADQLDGLCSACPLVPKCPKGTNPMDCGERLRSWMVEEAVG